MVEFKKKGIVENNNTVIANSTMIGDSLIAFENGSANIIDRIDQEATTDPTTVNVSQQPFPQTNAIQTNLNGTYWLGTGGRPPMKR